jgi:hypothetical protein
MMNLISLSQCSDIENAGERMMLLSLERAEPPDVSMDVDG